MPTPFDPTGTAAKLPASIDLVDDEEVIDFTSYQDGEFKPAFNAIKWMELHAAVDEDAAGELGDPDDSNPRDFSFSAAVRLVDNGSDTAVLELGANTSLEATDPEAFVRTQCRKRLLRRRAGAPNTLADSNHTLDVTQGDRFTLHGAPAAARTITISKTTGTPEEGETITVFFFSTLDSAAGGAPALAYSIKRADTTVIAEIYPSSQENTPKHYWVEVEYSLISTGPDVYDWRLGKHSGAWVEFNQAELVGNADLGTGVVTFGYGGSDPSYVAGIVPGSGA